MSLTRAVAAVGLAFAIAFVVLSWRSHEAAPQAATEVAPARTEPVAVGSGVMAPISAGPRAPAPAPSLADEPFAGQELAMTSESPDAPAVALRSSSRSGRDLSIELALREPIGEGKQVFATVSVSDALGNTVLDCTWRDIELADAARKLDCELPEGVALPLTISGHQRSAPGFIETPTVVAVDKGVHR